MLIAGHGFEMEENIMDINKGIKPEWDYTCHAEFYRYRPNYAPKAIERLCKHVGADKNPQYKVADIGAGTGNLTLLLQDKVGMVTAVEPNEAMRNIGVERTRQFGNVKWRIGTGEHTGLESNSIDWITFGSSFNTTERDESLSESHRVLKSEGYFTCMWNNRDLNTPTQKKVEGIIREYVPQYSHGTRREQQADTIISSRLFNHLYYLEEPQDVEMNVDAYLNAWKSVKNPYWDVKTEQGKKLFEQISSTIKQEFAGVPLLKLRYITKAWTAKKE